MLALPRGVRHRRAVGLVPLRRHPARALPAGRGGADDDAGRDRRAAAVAVALRGGPAGIGHTGHARRGDDPAPPARVRRTVARRGEDLSQGRSAQSDGIVQGARDGDRGHDGARAGRAADRASVGGERRERRRRVRGRRGPGGPALPAGADARAVPARGRRVRRDASTSCEGDISTCGRACASATTPADWFDLSTLREPYRLEGKKTLGYELAEQLDWTLPDVIVYPTGGGTGLIGMWKAFEEMEQLGLIDAGTAPAHGHGAGGRVRADRRGLRERRAAGDALARPAHLRVRAVRAVPAGRRVDPPGAERLRRNRGRGQRRGDGERAARAGAGRGGVRLSRGRAPRSPPRASSPRSGFIGSGGRRSCSSTRGPVSSTRGSPACASREWPGSSRATTTRTRIFRRGRGSLGARPQGTHAPLAISPRVVAEAAGARFRRIVGARMGMGRRDPDSRMRNGRPVVHRPTRRPRGVDQRRRASRARPLAVAVRRRRRGVRCRAAKTPSTLDRGEARRAEVADRRGLERGH